MNLDENSRLYPQRASERSFPVTTQLERALIVIVAIAVTVAIGLVICLVSIERTSDECYKELKTEQENTCLSVSCISEASNLMKSMDFTVDPCTDFYSFVCGNWEKNNYLVTSLESQFTKLSRIITLRVKEILEDLEKESSLPEHKQKTRDFYKSCMDKTHRNFLGAKELLRDLEKFGGWPIIEENWDMNFDWADLMIQLFKEGYIYNLLFTLRVDIDVKNASRSLISVNQPSFGLLKREYYILPLDSSIASYKNVIFALAKLLKGDISEENSKKDIEEAFQIEKKIAKLAGDINMNYPENYYNIRTLEELETSASMIPWRKILENLLSPDTELTSKERIMVTSPSMIKGLNSLLEDLDSPTGKRKLANYMFYRVVFDAANYLSRDFSLLVTRLFETDKNIRALPWEICTAVTTLLFQLPITTSYVVKYMDNRTKEELTMMVEDMKNTLMDQIGNAKWLDEETKNFAFLKVKKMKAAIAYEDEIMDDDNLDIYYKEINMTENYFANVKQIVSFELRKTMEGLHEKRIRFKWTNVDHLLTANAYYRPNENSIIIPVGVLQDVIFAAGRPSYINYGSLGSIVGHELTHAFDSIGSLYDDEGSHRMWWSEKSWKKFEDKMRCYEDQYSNYYLPIAKSNVNGTLTLAENIADNGGLQTAYYAYKALLKRIGSEKYLPGLPYNERQMFWISFASVWCKKQTDDSIQYAMKHSVHTPSRYRVIGSLSNMKEFSEDFNCTLNSTMNPISRCHLWK